MRILADENCDRRLVLELREAGHDVLYAAESTGGATDTELIELAARQERLIITSDRDFGLLVERETRKRPSIVLLRLDQLGRAARIRRAVHAVASLPIQVLDELIVVEPAQIRRRRYVSG